MACARPAHPAHDGPVRPGIPPWRQPRGKLMVSLVNSHTNATRIGWHLWEIDLRFAPGLPPGWFLIAPCPQNKLMIYHQKLTDDTEDQLSLASIHYLRNHYQVSSHPPLSSPISQPHIKKKFTTLSTLKRPDFAHPRTPRLSQHSHRQALTPLISVNPLFPAGRKPYCGLR